VIATRLSSITRKPITPALHCSNPRFLRRIARRAYHVRDSCFKPDRLLLRNYLTRHHIIQETFGKRLLRGLTEQKLGLHENVTISKPHSPAISLNRYTHGLHTVEAKVSLTSPPSRCLALTTHPCSSVSTKKRENRRRKRTGKRRRLTTERWFTRRRITIMKAGGWVTLLYRANRLIYLLLSWCCRVFQ